MGKEKVLSDKELKWIDKKIASELKPFLDGIRIKHASYELFKRAYLNYKERINPAAQLTLSLDKEVDKITSELYKIFCYLGIVESLGNTIIDLVVLLLIANGTDFHIECQHRTPRIKHATTIQDLERERVSLTTKLNFLRDNGLTTLASLVDTQLRNSIAHMNFDLKDGKIFVKGKHLTSVKLTNIVRKTVQALMVTDMLISKVMEEKGLV